MPAPGSARGCLTCRNANKRIAFKDGLNQRKQFERKQLERLKQPRRKRNSLLAPGVSKFSARPDGAGALTGLGPDSWSVFRLENKTLEKVALKVSRHREDPVILLRNSTTITASNLFDQTESGRPNADTSPSARTLTGPPPVPPPRNRTNATAVVTTADDNTKITLPPFSYLDTLARKAEKDIDPKLAPLVPACGIQNKVTQMGRVGHGPWV
ncbi:hypothetical protein AAL_05277 [Moelleriella libera RCEF 2490]|uniref:Uncharacterized protein n=1 Tax=Moelleriella libera RCEF 2490 TaxID=1081109 RepID=A0A166P441_9HYPO|nr:hypothetical protein AAL_05277 [Moelleriella libera RCEF 2490]